MPKPHDEIITDPNPKDVLIHWVTNKYPLKINGILNAEKLIEIKRIPGLSHNKLPPAKINDIFIKFKSKKQYEELWNIGENCQKVNRSDFFYDYKNRNYFFISVMDVSYQDKYKKPYNAPQAEFCFNVKPIHKPTRSNYSHFELEITNEDGVIKNFSSSWRKLIGPSIRTKYEEIAFFELPNKNQ